jgi:hypothetical protein
MRLGRRLESSTFPTNDENGWHKGVLGRTFGPTRGPAMAMGGKPFKSVGTSAVWYITTSQRDGSFHEMAQ